MHPHPRLRHFSFGSELGHALDCPMIFRSVTLSIGIKLDVALDGVVMPVQS